MKRALKELAIAGKPTGIRKLAKRTGMPPTTMLGVLKDLEEKEITIREYGTELKYKTPLCYIFDSPNVPYAYLGLLGERKERSETETETALKLLAKENFKFDRITVFTTYKSIPEWEEVALSNVNWHLLKDKEITVVKTVESKIEQVLTDLIRKYILIMDCTSLTKPATIAYYKLATGRPTEGTIIRNRKRRYRNAELT